jgi:thiol-disulfide isomerase/thioredoxin
MKRLGMILAVSVSSMFLINCKTVDKSALHDTEVVEQEKPFALENKVYKITENKDDLADFIKIYKAGGLMLIKYGADWCPPCKMFNKNVMPNLKKYSKAGNYMIVDINVDHINKVPTEWRNIITQIRQRVGTKIPRGAILFGGEYKKTFTNMAQYSTDQYVNWLADYKEEAAIVLANMDKSDDSSQADLDQETASDSNPLIQQINLGSDFSSVTYNVIRDETGNPIRLSALGQPTIELTLEKEFMVGLVTYKVRKSGDKVTGLLNCTEGTCQLIPL